MLREDTIDASSSTPFSPAATAADEVLVKQMKAAGLDSVKVVDVAGDRYCSEDHSEGPDPHDGRGA